VKSAWGWLFVVASRCVASHCVGDIFGDGFVVDVFRVVIQTVVVMRRVILIIVVVVTAFVSIATSIKHLLLYEVKWQ